MRATEHTPFLRLLQLIIGALRPPPGAYRIAVALAYGVVCHVIFGLAVVAMIVAMFFGMSKSLGTVSAPYSYLVNVLLLVQFPVAHSVLLTTRGGKWLLNLAPRDHARTLMTTTYAIIASIQLLLLFALWTPSGVVWWSAEGGVFWLMCSLYAGAWGLLIKASYDAGAEVQSGALGWMSLMAKIKPVFPDMPTDGLFRLIRQPIYVAFVLTLWTVPVWTPDQLAVATILTAYCLGAPILKERRFNARYGARFAAYKSRVPYAIPSPRGRWRSRSSDDA